MARKRFGVSSSINKALTQTIQMAEAENTDFINTEILINRIKLDPENPRKHKITIDDLKNGPSNNDPNYETKEKEYKGIAELSASIKKEGLLHPIVVFKNDEDYQLVTGERRFLASILAGKKIIDARVFKRKPKLFDLKIIQWIENESRKDLSLYNKLLNIDSILEAYQAENNQKMTAIKLSEIISCSRASAQFYVAILSNQLLMELISKGRVSTFREARKLSSIKSREDLQKTVIEGSGLLKQETPAIDAVIKESTNRVGRKRATISLGSTKKSYVVKVLVDSVLATKKFSELSSEFTNIDWHSLDDSTKAIQKLIKLIEKELETM